MQFKIEAVGSVACDAVRCTCTSCREGDEKCQNGQTHNIATTTHTTLVPSSKNPHSTVDAVSIQQNTSEKTSHGLAFWEPILIHSPSMALAMAGCGADVNTSRRGTNKKKLGWTQESSDSSSQVIRFLADVACPSETL